MAGNITAANAQTLTIVAQLRSRTSMLRARELAVTIGLSRRTISRMVRKGEIPHLRVRHTLRFDPQLIAAWVEERSI